MSFYKELSKHYDSLFSVQPRDMDFIQSLLGGCRSVLDIGCGTGNKTEFFAMAERNVTGIDLDPEMIALATAGHAKPGVRYAVLDMLSVGQRFAAQTFDGIVCLGNTLVHLTAQEERQAFMRQAASLLTTSGVFIVQILNYDYIVDGCIENLPVIDTGQVVFRRTYRPAGELVRFMTQIEVKNTGISYHNDIPLYPLRQAALTELCRSVGFRRPEYYGGYDGCAHTSESLVTMAVCHKL